MTQTNFPEQIPAGLTLNVVLSLANYPAPDWVITAHLRGNVALDIVATADGSNHKFTKTAAETAEFTPGRYHYTLRAVKGDEVHQVQAGQVDILPDLAAVSGPYDGRTENEKALEAIDAVISKRASLDQERYRINNRELYRTPIADLIRLRSFYVAAVRREKNKASGISTFGRPITVRFK